MDPKRIVSKYFLFCLLATLAYVCLTIVLVLHVKNFWLLLLLCAMLYFSFKAVIRYIAVHTIESVLYNDFDAKTFQEIINDRRFCLPIGYRINAAIELGLYKEAIDSILYVINSKKHSVYKMDIMYSLLGRIYFESRDFDNLRHIINDRETLKQNKSNNFVFRNTDSWWSYYDYYLKGDFAACKIICKERKTMLNKRNFRYKYMMLHNDLYLAIACYENGEINLSKSLFEQISKSAPNMFVSDIAKEYNNAIDTGNNIDIFKLLSVSNAYSSVDIKKSILNNRRFRLVSILRSFILVALILFFPFARNNSMENLSDLDNEMFKYYYEDEIITYFDLEHNGEFIGRMCFVDRNNKGIEITEFIPNEDGEDILAHILFEHNIKEDGEKFPLMYFNIGEYEFKMKISTEKIPEEGAFFYSNFKYLKRDFWMRIDLL